MRERVRGEREGDRVSERKCDREGEIVRGKRERRGRERVREGEGN